MWNKILIIAVCYFFLQTCKEKNVIPKESMRSENPEYYINSDSERCFVFWSNNHKFPEIFSKRLNFRFDEIESHGGGLDYRTIISEKNIRFITFGSSKTHSYTVDKIAENGYSFGKSPDILYFGFSYDPTYKRDRISIYDSKENLIKDKEIAIGHFVVTKDGLCIDRARLNSIYEQTKREVESGPEPDGADPELLQKMAEEEERKSGKK